MKKNPDKERVTSDSLRNLIDSHNRKRATVLVCSALAVVVAAATVAEMVQPATAVTRKESVLDCDFEVHEHTDECYKILYDEEGNETGKELICGQADYVVHTHTDECYKTVVHGDGIEEKVLVCELPEIEEHVHDESCYEEQKVLICEEDHEHTEECYETQKVLVCGQLELHEHTDECYKILYDEEGNEISRELICGKTKLLKHEHDENCFKEVEVAAEEETEEAEPAAEEAETEEVIESGEEKPAQNFEGETEELYITVAAPEGAFPEGTEMNVVMVEDEGILEAAADAAGSVGTQVTKVQAADITFKDAEGKEIEPELPIQVMMTAKERKPETEETAAVYHIDDEGEALAVELDEERPEEAAASFAADAFSVYALVYTVELETEVITADGDTYAIKVTFGPETEIPSDAVLDVKELKAEEEGFDEYVRETENALSWGECYAENTHLFDISIVDKEDSSVHYQPAEGTKVGVDIRLKDADDRDLYVVHFSKDESENETAEALESVTENKTVSFETTGFSIYAITARNVTSNLNGRSFALVSTRASMMESVQNAEFTDQPHDFKGLGAAALNIINNNGTDYIISSEDITLWKFTDAGGGYYYIQDPEGRYMNIRINPDISGGEYADVWLSDEPVIEGGVNYSRLYVKLNNSYPGEVRIQLDTLINNNEHFGPGLDVWNNKVSDGFHGYMYQGANNYLTLYAVNQVVKDNKAYKIKLEDLVEQGRETGKVEDVVIYIRRENADRDAYDYYAVASDGKLTLVHDMGDRIGWTDLESAVNHIEWDYSVYTTDAGGQTVLTNYFDFQSRETGQYLIPDIQTGDVVKADDPDDEWDLGVNMPGVTNGTYGSTVDRWDEGIHSYVGYKVVNDPSVPNGLMLEPTSNESEKVQFLFATIDNTQDSATNKLHPITTLDGKDYGIKITMYDFGNTRMPNQWPPRSQEIQSVIGTTAKAVNSTNINGIGYANTGLVSTTLDSRGFPTATETGRSLEDLFSSGNKKSEASNLFYQQVYDETGYFSYDSSISYAYLDQDKGEFTLYEEVAAPEMEAITGSFNPSRPDQGLPAAQFTPSGQKGNFFPFISLEELLQANSFFTDRGVLYDGDFNQLDVSHPQYGDILYKVPFGTRPYTSDPFNQVASYDPYFFGMTMEGEFYQRYDGKDKFGDDVIFEFNGDDDMWLYIDGVLGLDIGGTHGAVAGTINFSTGDINVYGAAGHEYHKTIRQIFEDEGIFPDGTPWDPSRVDVYFKNNTFADYTQHSFKMFYMERGSYASNLLVNFNLPTIEPSTFTLEKELPEEVQGQYGNTIFAYQVYTVDSYGNRHLYTPPAGRNVVYEGTEDAALFASSYQTIDGNTYQNVYFLRPGEAIVFPVEHEGVEYYIREIGLDNEIWTEASVNGTDVPIEQRDRVFTNDNVSPTYMAVADRATVRQRGRVIYENVPAEDRVHKLRLRKIIDSPVKDPDARFRFDVYFEQNDHQDPHVLTAYNRGPYYIIKENDNGEEIYYMYEEGDLVESPGNVPVEYTSGINGAIDKIPEDFTIVIPGMLAGTDFYVVENIGSLPSGYTYVGRTVEYAGDPDPSIHGTVGDETVDSLGQIRTYDEDIEEDALVTITNRPTARIVVEKEWEDGDFVTEHADIYVALYKKTTEGSTVSYDLIDGSAKKLEYDAAAQKYRTEYYVPVNSETLLSDYAVREVNVSVTEEDDTEVITVLSMVDDKEKITLTGEATLSINGAGTGTDAENSYVVTYEEGDEEEYLLDPNDPDSETGTERTDTVTNTLPKISLFKINEADSGPEKKYLSDAVFEMQDEAGDPILDDNDNPIRFTSDTNGMLFENRRFSNGTYYFEEIQAPNSYIALTERIVLTVAEDGIVAKLENSDNTIYMNQIDDSTIEFKFEIMNNPGVELPYTGGPGTGMFTLLGTMMILSALGIFIRKRRAA